MKKRKPVMVLVPCRNEEGRIGAVVESVRTVLPGVDVVVVDDASVDGSAAEAVSAGALLLAHPVHLGYGAALETGYMYARGNGYDTVLQMDGDGQHLARGLVSLRDALASGDADIVIGSRYLCEEGAPAVGLIRRAGQRLFSRILRVLTGLHLTDPTSGFQAIGRRALAFLSSGIFPCDYPDADVILMAHQAGLRIREIPTTMIARSNGRSMHLGLKPVYYAMKMFLSLFVVLLNHWQWQKWGREERM